MKTQIVVLVAFLLSGGYANAEEMPMHSSIEQNGAVLSQEYNLNLDFLGERWNIFCKRSRLQPKVGVIVEPSKELCAIEDKEGVAHISIYAENLSFYDTDVVRPDSRQPLTFRYTESHPWKDLMAEQLLSHLAKMIENSLIPHRHRGEFVVSRLVGEKKCDGDAHNRFYTLTVQGFVVDERGGRHPISRSVNVAFGFFPHLVEYEFVGEMGWLPAPILRELYFTIAVYSYEKTADITTEACEIINALVSQAKKN